MNAFLSGLAVGILFTLAVQALLVLRTVRRLVRDGSKRARQRIAAEELVQVVPFRRVRHASEFEVN